MSYLEYLVGKLPKLAIVHYENPSCHGIDIVEKRDVKIEDDEAVYYDEGGVRNTIKMSSVQEYSPPPKKLKIKT